MKLEAREDSGEFRGRNRLIYGTTEQLGWLAVLVVWCGIVVHSKGMDGVVWDG